MKRQLPIALVLLALACTPILAVAQSNGEIAMVANASYGGGSNPKECDFWTIKHRGKTQGNGQGSCQSPVLSVYAMLQGASAGGISGAEYAATIGPDDGPDAGYFLIDLPNPTATTLLGSAWSPPDPSPRGVNMSWSSCQTGDGNRVLLGNVIVFSTGACGPGVQPLGIDFGGVGHSSPSNVFFRCPLLTLCDGPVFTKVCMGTDIVDCQTPVPPFPIASKCSTSGSFSVNGADGSCVTVKTANSSVTIQNDTWSNVKSLYN